LSWQLLTQLGVTLQLSVNSQSAVQAVRQVVGRVGIGQLDRRRAGVAGGLEIALQLVWLGDVQGVEAVSALAQPADDQAVPLAGRRWAGLRAWVGAAGGVEEAFGEVRRTVHHERLGAAAECRGGGQLIERRHHGARHEGEDLAAGAIVEGPGG
jgi:hypothetical protein